jgi:hypothetical protein
MGGDHLESLGLNINMDLKHKISGRLRWFVVVLNRERY